MKNIFYSLLALTTIVCSCQKKVTEIEPQNLLPTELAFKTPDRMERSVLASYEGLQSAEFLSGRALVYVDLMGEDIFDRTSFFGDLSRFNMLANNGLAANVWSAGYNSIQRANRGIEGVTANPDVVDATTAKGFIAECKFVRAVAHFYLVNFFAQTYVFTADASHPGIPIVLNTVPTSDLPAGNIARSTVAQVYTQIIKDLTEALADLPADYGDPYPDKTRATKAAAASFLSRVYLYKADYANAKTSAKSVIDGLYGAFDLTTAVNGAFGPANGYTTEETVWSIPNNQTDNPNTNNSLPQHYYPSGRADLAVSSSFLGAATNIYFAADDKRRTQMIIPGVASTNTTAFKFTNKYPDVSQRADWAPIIRYAEVLLNYAEAAARVGTGIDADALVKLNKVRDRARVSAPQYIAASFADKNAFIAAILGERRIELAFEGHRFWDLMRTKSNVANKYDNDGTTLLPVQTFGADKNIFPIPQNEIDKSKGTLLKNNGY